jgi:hypothetical protein
MYCTQWFITLFTGNFKIEISARIWDLFLLSGIKIIYKTSIAILQIFEKELISYDFENIMKFFQKQAF